MLNVLIVAVTIAAAGLLFHPLLARRKTWRATITPLASIIGSGFLVLGPILNVAFGFHAPLVMAVLCVLAYAYGAAIRFNITRLEAVQAARTHAERKLETVSSWALAFAYIISVAYYLNLLGAFTLSLTPLDTETGEKSITTAVFLMILIVGWTRGFHALERMEQISVGLKLAIIVGLLFGLAVFFGKTMMAGALITPPPTVNGWQAFALVAGLLVTVQGFETSRYLGNEYEAKTRVRSMKLAQWTSAAIYMVYIVLISFVFELDTGNLSETAIIELMSVIAPVLPLLLVASAISAQFSAAVADTSGCGGLVDELSGGRITSRAGYTLLCFIGVGMTWTFGVFEIISYASRSFALYYALQALIAARGAFASNPKDVKGALFACLSVLGFAIAIFGTAIE